jgi:rhodanese-related sulfurtransferase
MQHLYFKEKINPPQEPLSPKAFAIAIGAILLITIFFLVKTIIQKNNSSEKSQAEEKSAVKNVDFDLKLILGEEASRKILDNSYQLLDIRERSSYEKKHIENSINISSDQLETNYFIMDKSKKIILIDQTVTDQTKTLASKIKSQGFDVRILDGGFEKYYFEGWPIISEGDPEAISDKAKTKPLSADELIQKIKSGQTFSFLDTRKKSDFEKSHIQGAVNIPLEDLEARKKEIPLGKILICDEDPLRSFQANVRLFDMRFWTAEYLSENLSILKKRLEETTDNQQTPSPSQ